MQYTIYAIATGEICCNGSTNADNIPIEEGRALYAGAMFSAKTHYFVDGQPQEYTEEQRAAKAVRPPFPGRWDNATMSWHDTRDLTQRKADLRRAIERERDARLAAAVIVYDGKNIDADQRSIDNVDKKLSELRSHVDLGTEPPAQTMVWRDADNITHTFATFAEYKNWLDGLAVALGARGTLAYAWSWAKKAAVDAAQTVAEVDAISLQD